MPPVGFETWFPKQCPTSFVVKNIAPGNKRVHVFHYPIANGMERDLMAIPYVSEADIRHSLLKGELYTKLLCRDIRVTESNIDLIQFDACHKNFLQQAGITIGLDCGGSGSNVRYLFRQNVPLIGPLNNANRVFMVPYQEKFLNNNFDGNDFRIIVEHNGRRLIENVDYTVLESTPGSGYDLIRMDSFVPNTRSHLIADYVIENSI
jgi:hypothetical protein